MKWIKASERLPVGKKPAINTYIGEAGWLIIEKDRAVFYQDGKDDDKIYYNFDDEKLYNHIQWLESTLSKGGKEDEFVNKHLVIIMDKTLDSMIVTHIEKMWGGLQMASVQHFVDTGKVSGSLHLAVKELAKSFAANWHNTVSQPPTSLPEGVSAEGMKSKWYDFLSGKGETAAEIACYITDSDRLLTQRDAELKESLLLYQNMCDQITKDQQEIIQRDETIRELKKENEDLKEFAASEIKRLWDVINNLEKEKAKLQSSLDKANEEIKRLLSQQKEL